MRHFVLLGGGSVLIFQTKCEARKVARDFKRLGFKVTRIQEGYRRVVLGKTFDGISAKWGW